LLHDGLAKGDLTIRSQSDLTIAQHRDHSGRSNPLIAEAHSILAVKAHRFFPVVLVLVAFPAAARGWA